MALVIENGTGVVGANSYATLATIRTYAANRGVTLSADDTVLEPLVHKAMDFIEGHRGRFQGSKTDTTQALQWPRTGVSIDGEEIDTDAIPDILVSLLCRLCMEQDAGTDLTPTRNSAFITEEKVGPLTTKYSEAIGGGAGSTPTMPAVDALLEPLLKTGTSGALFTTIRA